MRFLLHARHTYMFSPNLNIQCCTDHDNHHFTGENLRLRGVYTLFQVTVGKRQSRTLKPNSGSPSGSDKPAQARQQFWHFLFGLWATLSPLHPILFEDLEKSYNIFPVDKLSNCVLMGQLWKGQVMESHRLGVLKEPSLSNPAMAYKWELHLLSLKMGIFPHLQVVASCLQYIWEPWQCDLTKESHTLSEEDVFL